MIYWLAWGLLKPILALVIPTKIYGKCYLKKVKRQAAIFCANHQSNWDPVLVKLRVDAGSKVMGKHTLFKGPLGWFLRKAGAYPVNREGGDIQAVKTTLSHLKDNKHIVIFPEGTRLEGEEMTDVKNGVVMFALKTDCYVIPAAFKEKPKTLKFNKLLIGEPFKFSQFNEFKGVKPTKEVLDKASEILVNKINQLKKIDIKEFKKKLTEFKLNESLSKKTKKSLLLMK